MKPNGDDVTVLHAFDYSSEDASPTAGLIQDSGGNLDGTTPSGGVSADGTVYQLKHDGDVFTLLHAYHYSDGASPPAGLSQDSAGNLYGTTYAGGTAGYGTVYKRDGATGAFSILFSFGQEPKNP